MKEETTGNQKIEIDIIARIETDFPSKFGIPRQGGLVEDLEGRIVFEPGYRKEDAVKGMENFTHLWLTISEIDNGERLFEPGQFAANLAA